MHSILLALIVLLFSPPLLMAQNEARQTAGKVIVELTIEGFPNETKLEVPISLNNRIGEAIGGGSGPSFCSHCTNQSIAKYSFAMSAKKRNGKSYRLAMTLDALFEDGKTIAVKKVFLFRRNEQIRWAINNRIQVKIFLADSFVNSGKKGHSLKK